MPSTSECLAEFGAGLRRADPPDDVVAAGAAPSLRELASHCRVEA